MKFALAYYLLLLYSTVILKPLIPIMKDGIEHCFAEAYHVATVHAKYGNNHLEKELAATSSDTNNKDQNSVKSEEATSLHIVTAEYNYEYFLPKLITNFSVLSLLKTPSVFIAKYIPPPKI